MILIGASGFTIVLTIAGLIQGNAWYVGETVYRVLPEIHMYYIARAAIGLLVFSSALLGLYNVLRTLFFNPGAKLS
jgi:cytochrome c oxidase cbb3-type subunit 1/cytochrome c oxidase cbb3-type subunit I/II